MDLLNFKFKESDRVQGKHILEVLVLINTGKRPAHPEYRVRKRQIVMHSIQEILTDNVLEKGGDVYAEEAVLIELEGKTILLVKPDVDTEKIIARLDEENAKFLVDYDRTAWDRFYPLARESFDSQITAADDREKAA